MENRNSSLNINEFSTADVDIFSNHLSVSEIDHEVLILSIDLGEGIKEKVTVYENDIPEQIAQNFCAKHQLGPKTKLILTEEIEKNLQNLYSRQLTKMPENEEPETKSPRTTKGEELYMRGIKSRQRVEGKHQAFRDERIVNEMKNVTFKPAVNSPERRNRPPEQSLLEKGKQTFEMIQKKRSEGEVKMLNGCTFSPEINKSSANMKSSRARSPERYLSLYQDAKNIKEKIIKKSQQL